MRCLNLFELVHGSAHAELLESVVADIAQVSPETRVHPQLVDFADPAVWAWIAVVAMLALPAAATLA